MKVCPTLLQECRDSIDEHKLSLKEKHSNIERLKHTSSQTITTQKSQPKKKFKDPSVGTELQIYQSLTIINEW